MPFYPTNLKTLIIDMELSPTIPLVYLYTLQNIYRQIVNQDLYKALLASDITWELLDSGDFLIHDTENLEDLNEELEEFYGLPPTPACKGKTLLVTYTSSIKASHTASIEATSEVIPPLVCKGSTILVSSISSIKNILSAEITTTQSEFIE